ncbi:MAG TPA: glycoside hydrolase family 3 C-terminal domain-containing protein, partial [Prolixibacteraceae bacterium]|nr:glycoside hydrolase family 3 C-terminal domain-containing protein [Prolixibacteraceae bacterium]
AEILFARGYPSAPNWFGRLFWNKTPEEREKMRLEQERAALDLKKEAIETAAKADIVLFIGGNNRSVETEGRDRRDIFLPSGQDELVRSIAEVNPNIVTVLVSGAPNDLNVVQPLSKALLLSWFNGSEGGNALADVLLGIISPGGRMPFTLPIKLDDSPAYAMGNYPQGEQGSDIFANLVAGTGDNAGRADSLKPENDPNTALYSEESLVGYRWFDTKNVPVLYPFGYGLTYASFEYANLKTNKNTFGKNDAMVLSFDLKNTGTMPADEVVQAYVHRVNPSVEWPYKELKAFSRVSLQPGQSKTVDLEIPVKSLMFWNESLQAWAHDPCTLELLVGASAGDIRLKKEVRLR